MTLKLEVVRPEAGDWRGFLAVAGEAGWRVPVTELNLFRVALANGALALRCNGGFAGLVTFVHHGASAWIGNLIVRPDLRGLGLGKRLLQLALARLQKKQAVSVWLTASDAGFCLYQRRGFDTVGRVERWVRSGGGDGLLCGSTRDLVSEGDGRTADALRKADARAWGGRRLLLDLLLGSGRPFACGSSTALLQREPGMQVLGPWFADGAGENDHRRLLTMAVAAANVGEELVADVLAGVLPAQVFEEAGFILQGSTRLMVRGNTPGIDLSRMVSFASLGSMG